MTNLLSNGGFEGGAWRQTFNGSEYGEISVPIGWTAFWDVTMGRPEMKVIQAVAPYLDPPRVFEGKQAVQWFTFYRTHDAGLFQRVSLPAGSTLELSALAHVWYSQRDDPHKSEYHKDSAPDVWYQFTEADPGMQVMLGIDPTGGMDWNAASVRWAIENYYDQPWEIALQVEDCGAAVTVFLRTITAWPFKHCDAYWDDVRLEIVADPEPEPEPECVGLPREDYVRTVNVIRKDATAERAAAIFKICWANGRQTVTGSYDDAGIGDLTEKTAVLWDIDEFARPDYVAFFDEHYPGTRVVFQGDSEPLPPVGGEPTPYVLRSNNLIGLHSGFVLAQTWNYIEQSGTTCQKFFSAGDCYRAKQRAPQIVTVWRKFVDALPFGSVDDQAAWYVQQYRAELVTASGALGISVDTLLSGIDGIESYNEMIPSHNIPALQQAVAFDVAFAECLWQVFGNKAHPVLLNGAVGNPHETEVEYMLPAAKAAVAYGGFVGYHSYNAANRLRSYLAEGWPYHAGRWMEWDKVFTAHGVYPRYLSTESGRCFSPDGQWLNPALGWKSCGSIEQYLVDIDEYNRRCLVWNALHANRFTGTVLFGYGNWGWEDFELGDGEVILLNAWANGTPAVRAAAFELPVDPKAAYVNALEEYLTDTPYLADDARERMMRALYNGGEFEDLA
jgi:hypothetical protein